MSNNSGAQAAINTLNGEELKGQTLKVNTARPHTGIRGDRGGFGGGRRAGREGGNGFFYKLKCLFI